MSNVEISRSKASDWFDLVGCLWFKFTLWSVGL